MEVDSSNEEEEWKSDSSRYRLSLLYSTQIEVDFM